MQAPEHGRSDRYANLARDGQLIGTVTLASLALLVSGAQAVLSAPPRYDGAGYAVLAESLRTGRGYRAIDHPDAPLHAHFPPGYPAALAALWSLTGPSPPAAHGFSLACSVSAVMLFWIWLRRRVAEPTAWILAATVAVSWSWSRQAGSIQSEPLFNLLCMLALLAWDACAEQRSTRAAAWLGLVLGLATLTRHVAVMIAAAMFFELARLRQLRSLGVAAGLYALMLAPWFAWQWHVGRDSQIALFTIADLPRRMLSQALFYVGRVPDQIVGPLVEVGTVFRPAYQIPALVWGVCATTLVFFGWLRSLREPGLRVAALIPLFTLALLVAWPFTEAGRFLIPLIPFVIVGAWQGLRSIFAAARIRRAGSIAATVLLLSAIPYTALRIATGRAAQEERAHASFDAACAWIAAHGEADGPVLVRQSGEAFWQMGRRRAAMPPPVIGDHRSIADLIDRYQVAYLIVDRDRYARAEPSSLEQFVSETGLPCVFERARFTVYRTADPD